MAASDDKGTEDSAIFLLTLGEDAAAEVLKYMSPKEVQRLGTAMAAMQSVPKDRIAAVLERFSTDTQDQSGVGHASDEYLRNVLTRALGSDKAGFLLDRILQTGDTSGIESLKWMDAASVAELIRNEHPQIIASILVHLEPDQSASILNQFTDRLKSDVILRIATLEGIQPTALKELNDVLLKMLSGSEQVKRSRIGGIKTAAEILNYVGSSSETAIVENVKEFDAELAQKILDEMFTFDNLLDIDDRGIQLVLREVQSESLVIALKGASPELRDKIFRNMSSRAAEMLREDLESKGPVKVSEVEAEQKEILKVVRRLSEEGQIAIGGKGDDAFL
jgi:flagellar motor switch protein FliG